MALMCSAATVIQPGKKTATLTEKSDSKVNMAKCLWKVPYE